MITKADKRRIVHAAKQIAVEASDWIWDRFSDFDAAQDHPDDETSMDKYQDEVQNFYAKEIRKAIIKEL